MRRKNKSQMDLKRGKKTVTIDGKTVTTDETIVTTYNEKKNSFKRGRKGKIRMRKKNSYN